MTYRNTILLTLFGAALWGLYWVPIYILEAVGFKGPSAAWALGLGSLPVLFVLTYWKRDKPLARLAICGGLVAGIGVGLWGASVAFTDVVRAILLFYLLPVWTTLIDTTVFRQRFTVSAGLAIICSLAGIVIICGGGIPLDGLGALGDWLALTAGLLFAIGMSMVFANENLNVPKVATMTTLGAVLAGGICVFLFQNNIEQTVLSPTHIGLPIVLGSLYFVPLLLITLWSVTKLRPVTLSFILTGEVVVGVVTSALFLDQVFGVPEAAGAVLIMAGAVIKVFGEREISIT